MTGEWPEMTGSPILAPGCYQGCRVGSNSLLFNDLHGCDGSAQAQPLRRRLRHLVELEWTRMAPAERVDRTQDQECDGQHGREGRCTAGAKRGQLDVRELVAEEHEGRERDRPDRLHVARQVAACKRHLAIAEEDRLEDH